MEGSVEAALRYALVTLLVLGAGRLYFEFVKLSALRDIVNERPTLLGWIKAGLVPCFAVSFLAALWLKEGSTLGARGDFAFWFVYLFFTLLVIVSFARQTARKESGSSEDRLPPSPLDPIGWLRKKLKVEVPPKKE